MEIDKGEDEVDPTPEAETEPARSANEGQHDPIPSDDDLVEVDVYDNDWYESKSEDEQMFTM
jgi:hypothetical protein